MTPTRSRSIHQSINLSPRAICTQYRCVTIKYNTIQLNSSPGRDDQERRLWAAPASTPPHPHQRRRPRKRTPLPLEKARQRRRRDRTRWPRFRLRLWPQQRRRHVRAPLPSTKTPPRLGWRPFAPGLPGAALPPPCGLGLLSSAGTLPGRDRLPSAREGCFHWERAEGRGQGTVLPRGGVRCSLTCVQ